MGYPDPQLEKTRQFVRPHREAIASPKLVPKHQHDQRGPSLAVVSLLAEAKGKALPDKL